MSYFRNFGNVVCSQLLTKPNNLVLRSGLSRVLCQNTDPSINHLHTVKALTSTISILRSYLQSLQGQYLEQVQSELRYLEKCKQQYQLAVRKYVQSNGNLTGQGIANVYAVAQQLNINSSWLQNYLHNQIPNKAQYMSRINLIDLKSALNKYHANSPHLNLVQKHLSNKGGQNYQIDYVQRIGNELNQYEFSQKVGCGNLLVHSIEKKVAFPVYLGTKWWCAVWSRIASLWGDQPRYNLHWQ